MGQLMSALQNLQGPDFRPERNDQCNFLNGLAHPKQPNHRGQAIPLHAHRQDSSNSKDNVKL